MAAMDRYLSEIIRASKFDGPAEPFIHLCDLCVQDKLTRRGKPRWSSMGWSGPASCRRRCMDLRDLTRLRTAITQERTPAIHRLEKVFQDAGIKLTSVGL